jgi:hypothetical protein
MNKMFVLLVSYDDCDPEFGRTTEVYAVSDDEQALESLREDFEVRHLAASTEWDQFDEGRGEWCDEHDRKFEELQHKFGLYGFIFGNGIEIFGNYILDSLFHS